MRRNKKPIKPKNHCLPSAVIIKKNAKLKAEIAPVTRPAKMPTNLFDRNSTISLNTGIVKLLEIVKVFQVVQIASEACSYKMPITIENLKHILCQRGHRA
jgi:hypothetical protein